MATGQRGHRARGTQAALILALLGAAAFLNGYIAETCAQPVAPYYRWSGPLDTPSQQRDVMNDNSFAQQNYDREVSNYLSQQRWELDNQGRRDYRR